MTYYHVELAEHAALCAEGTPCPPYLEIGHRHAFENGDPSALSLHPAFAPVTMLAAARVTESRLPFAEEGPAVEMVRNLLTCACIATNADAGLAITRQTDGSIRITSRSAIPGHVSPDQRDQRMLGVKIDATTRGVGTIIALNHPRLAVSWHGPEPDGRWTSGRAIIPAALCGGVKRSGSASPRHWRIRRDWHA